MQDYVVYIPKPGALFHIFQIEAGSYVAAVENKIVNIQAKSGQPGLTPGETAYVVISGSVANTKEEAFELAKAAKLTFIPKMITLGARSRNPEISMESIRLSFAAANRAYELEHRVDNLANFSGRLEPIIGVPALPKELLRHILSQEP